MQNKSCETCGINNGCGCGFTDTCHNPGTLFREWQPKPEVKTVIKSCETCGVADCVVPKGKRIDKSKPAWCSCCQPKLETLEDILCDLCNTKSCKRHCFCGALQIAIKAIRTPHDNGDGTFRVFAAVNLTKEQLEKLKSCG